MSEEKKKSLPELAAELKAAGLVGVAAPSPLEQVELVEVTVKIPRPVLEFYKALLAFEKSKDPLEELLVYQIIWSLQTDFGNRLETLLNVKSILEGYGLFRLKGFTTKELGIDC